MVVVCLDATGDNKCGLMNRPVTAVHQSVPALAPAEPASGNCQDAEGNLGWLFCNRITMNREAGPWGSVAV
jgi:hypothetical protein